MMSLLAGVILLLSLIESGAITMINYFPRSYLGNILVIMSYSCSVETLIDLSEEHFDHVPSHLESHPGVHPQTLATQ